MKCSFVSGAPSMAQNTTVNTLLSVFSLLNCLSVHAQGRSCLARWLSTSRLNHFATVCICETLSICVYRFKSPPARSFWRKGHWWFEHFAEVTPPEWKHMPSGLSFPIMHLTNKAMEKIELWIDHKSLGYSGEKGLWTFENKLFWFVIIKVSLYHKWAVSC